MDDEHAPNILSIFSLDFLLHVFSAFVRRALVPSFFIHSFVGSFENVFVLRPPFHAAGMYFTDKFSAHNVDKSMAITFTTS